MTRSAWFWTPAETQGKIPTGGRMDVCCVCKAVGDHITCATCQRIYCEGCLRVHPVDCARRARPEQMAHVPCGDPWNLSPHASHVAPRSWWQAAASLAAPQVTAANYASHVRSDRVTAYVQADVLRVASARLNNPFARMLGRVHVRVAPRASASGTVGEMRWPGGAEYCDAGGIAALHDAEILVVPVRAVCRFPMLCDKQRGPVAGVLSVAGASDLRAAFVEAAGSNLHWMHLGAKIRRGEGDQRRHRCTMRTVLSRGPRELRACLDSNEVRTERGSAQQLTEVIIPGPVRLGDLEEELLLIVNASRGGTANQGTELTVNYGYLVMGVHVVALYVEFRGEQYILAMQPDRSVAAWEVSM